MSSNKIGLAVGAALAAGGLLLGGSALANAASGTSSATGSYGASGYGMGEGRGGSNDTPVTGSEAAKVTAAVKAKDSSVTVSSVRKDPDGSYDVLGTKSGNQFMYDVSADLETITQNAFGGGHDDGPSTSSSSPSNGSSNGSTSKSSSSTT